MDKKVKGLVLETIGEVLLEGRLEDVKAKYDNTYDHDIDRLSQGDPSGNNKYLAWMAGQFLVGYPDELTSRYTVEDIIDIIRRFHQNAARVNPKLSAEVVQRNSDLYPGKEARRVSNNPKDINSYSSMEGLDKVVEAAEENVPVSTERDKIYQDERWTVIIPKTHKASCKYGVHSNWCVSTSNQQYFQNYTREGMLAFVLWRDKVEGSESEGEYKIAAHVNYSNPEYDYWNWYNKKDTRVDNDMVLNVLGAPIINAIKGKIREHMIASGYYVDIDVDEIREKAHLLIIDESVEGEETYTFTPKKEFGTEWLEKYDEKTGILQGQWQSGDELFSNKLPIFTLTAPNGRLQTMHIDLVNTYNHLTRQNYWGRQRTKFQNFLQAVPYNLKTDSYHGYGQNRRGYATSMSQEKLEELFEYFKTYFADNFNGWLEVPSDTLQIGDEVRWKRKGYAERRRLGNFRSGKIIRQTPGGFFVVDLDNEPKPARFKPNATRYMGRRTNAENMDLSVFEDDND